MKRNTIIGLVAALVVFAGFSILSYYNFTHIVEMGRMRTRGAAFSELLYELTESLDRMELCHLRYMATGDRRYADQFSEEASSTRDRIKKLYQYSPPLDAGLRQKIAAVESLAGARFKNLGESIASTTSFPAKHGLLIREGEHLHHAIDTIVQGMLDHVKGRLARLGVEREKTIRDGLFTLSAGTVLSFLILFWIFNTLNHEVSVRRRTEVALRESEEKYRELVESANSIILKLDTEGNITFLNEYAQKFFGYAEAEVVGKNVIGTIVPPIDTAGRDLAGMVEDFKQHPEKYAKSENENMLKDGRRVWVNWANRAILDRKGNIAGFLSIGQDMTQARETKRELEHLSRNYELILDSAGEGILVLDSEGICTLINGAACMMLGYKSDELIGRLGHPIIHCLRPDNTEYPKEECPVYETLRMGISRHVTDEILRRKNGSVFPVEYRSTPIYENSRIVGAVITFSDISERQKTAQALQRANEDLARWVNELEQRNREIGFLSEMGSLLQASLTMEEAYGVIARSAQALFSTESGAVFLLNANRNVLEAIANWGDIKPEEQVFTPRECWALRLGREYVVDKFRAEMACQHIKDPAVPAFICVPMMAQGETLGLLHLRFSAVWLKAPLDERERTVKNKSRLAGAVAEDIALSLANFRLRESLYLQSIHDPLTGLCNRRYMSELLEKELHRMARKEKTLGLIMLDIDYFKRINDTLGHDAGDMILREFGSFLQKNIREEDFACRFGGEEFVIILPEASFESARDRAEQLRQSAKRLDFQYKGQSVGTVTISLGVAVFPKNGLNPDALLRAADSALYRAKAEGRDRVSVL
ncbi:MAG: diguanylate cyclase [Nitrospiraceae bacterium]|nr:diguanylate cyclase [Nitrospiraceae bacterium]